MLNGVFLSLSIFATVSNLVYIHLSKLLSFSIVHYRCTLPHKSCFFFSVNCTWSLMFSVSRSSSCGTLGSLGSPVSTLHVASDLSRSNTSPGAVSAVSAASQTVDDTDSSTVRVNTEAPSELDNTAAGAEAITFRCSSPSAANHHGGSLPHPSSMPSIRQPLVSSLGEYS